MREILVVTGVEIRSRRNNPRRYRALTWHNRCNIAEISRNSLAALNVARMAVLN